MTALVLAWILLAALGVALIVSRYRADERERVVRALGGEPPAREMNTLRALETRLRALEMNAQVLDRRVQQTLSEVRNLHATILSALARAEHKRPREGP